MVPIAGVIFGICYDPGADPDGRRKNNMHGDVDTWMFFKWIFKTAASVLIVTNTWNIVMGVFDVGQSVVNSAAGVIASDASIDISSVIVDMESRLMAMDLGPLFGLWFQSLFVGICTWALTICIFIITYGRMIEIYLVTSVAPIPMATMVSKESGNMGQNYLRSLFALAFQAFLIIVCVAIYAALVQNIAVDTDISAAIWTCIVVQRCFCALPCSRPVLWQNLFSRRTKKGDSLSINIKSFWQTRPGLIVYGQRKVPEDPQNHITQP